ncbi:concanavalin A-like lectin/glucanase [Rhizoclosmatium globosum]|uniref:Concanavalin A-like lectin/glucanase n=1 Tax=Rhizoclosmatium globosum TaxID=329046 RepID=A0A1Y2CL96_9FUNG|nr:concanavalin A-like lectin/glucanase [Rhizoclosmatium globosum]|eukprot:ORY47791.1 concanavalin A-like lectin/glucanase [Rhizoclosmatium globosum]
MHAFSALVCFVWGQLMVTAVNSCCIDIPSFSGPNDAFVIGGPGKVDYVDGALVMTLLPPNDGGDTGLSVIGTSSISLLYGTVEAVIQQSTSAGVVTYLTLINQTTKDEIDFEWIGNERQTVWTNFFYRGLRERDPVTLNEIWSSQVSTGSDDNSEIAHTYKIQWTPDFISWSVDGTIVHWQDKNDSPMTVNVGIWNDQDVVWANGPIDWKDPTTANGFSAKVLSLKVWCGVDLE